MPNVYKQLRSPIEHSLAVFLNATSFKDVASALEVPPAWLNYYLYRKKEPNYAQFEIRKKSGGFRKVEAPIYPIKILQRKLATILSEIYNPPGSAHGFCAARNIKSNAEKHVAQSWVLNFDIRSFFPSITFLRVYGLFRSHPFNFNKQVAHHLSKLACHNGTLPQGSPCSPIISNMICLRLDRQIMGLAAKHGIRYTRYADDVSLSHFKSEIPLDIVLSENPLVLGIELRRIVEKVNGFELNESKLRLSRRGSRQEVTGLVVNRFVNVRRSFVRDIRGAIHAWKTFGYEKANQAFQSRYAGRKKYPQEKQTELRHVLAGRIDFVRQIRGPECGIYFKFIKELHALDKTLVSESMLKRVEAQFLKRNTEIEKNLWVLASDSQGTTATAFKLKGVGIITAAHALADDLVAFRTNEVWKEFKVEVLKKNDELDVALVSIEGDTSPGFSRGNPGQVFSSMEAVLAGFPDFSPGNSPSIYSCQIAYCLTVSSIRNFRLDKPVVAGNSGGPLLTNDLKVVGIALKGSSGVDNSGTTSDHRVISIEAIDHLI